MSTNFLAELPNKELKNEINKSINKTKKMESLR